MALRTRYNFLIDEPQREALRRIKDRDGIPESEQIRRAIGEWLERRGEGPLPKLSARAAMRARRSSDAKRRTKG